MQRARRSNAGKAQAEAQIIGENVVFAVESPDGTRRVVRMDLAVMNLKENPFVVYYGKNTKGMSRDEKRAAWNSRVGINPMYNPDSAWTAAGQNAHIIGGVLGWVVPLAGPVLALVGFRAGKVLKDGGTPAQAARAGLRAYVDATIMGLNLLGLDVSGTGAQELAKADRIADDPRAKEPNTAQAQKAVHENVGGAPVEATNDFFADLGFTEEDGAEVAVLLDRYRETGSIASEQTRRRRDGSPRGRNRAQPGEAVDAFGGGGGGGYTFGGASSQDYGSAPTYGAGGYTF